MICCPPSTTRLLAALAAGPVIHFDEIDGVCTVVNPPDSSPTVPLEPITADSFFTPPLPELIYYTNQRDPRAPRNRAERRAGMRRGRRP